MVARRPEQAVDALLGHLRLIASCLSHQPVIGAGPRVLSGTIGIGFAPIRHPVPLDRADETGAFQLWFSESHAIERNPDDKRNVVVRRIGYVYRVLGPSSDVIISYHWHPTGASAAVHPHLHLSGRLSPIERGVARRPVALGDMHLPTGFITLADIVRLLIDEFGVQPLRDDWREVIAAGDDAQPVL